MKTPKDVQGRIQEVLKEGESGFGRWGIFKFHFLYMNI
jgi:hypothetical protein